MSANTELLGGRRAVRLPSWVVIAIGAALVGALAVASLDERDRPATDAAALVEEGPAGAQSDAAEMADMKTSVATQFWVQRVGRETGPAGASAAVDMAALKTAIATQFYWGSPSTPATPDEATGSISEGFSRES